MGDLILVTFVLACVLWAVIGFVWTASKILGFLSKFLEGESPAVSTPAYLKPPASPARPDVPKTPLHARTEPNSTWKMTRKQALNTVRFEVQRAFNLGLIPRDTYLAMGIYLDREKQFLKEPGPLAPPTPVVTLPEREPMNSTPTPVPAPTPEPTPEPVVPAIPAPVIQPDVVPEKIPEMAQEIVQLPPLQEVPGPLPIDDYQSPQNLARVRSAIARLHEHAQAPEEPEASISADTEAMAARVATDPVDTSPPRLSPPLVSVSNQASPPPHIVEQKAETPSAPVIKKSWAERLFTPENVRILQSLGICIMFISAVAFVRTNMWSDASPLVRMLILMAGTAACSTTGYALRRWLNLRITGLGFLILGQLSVMLDAYSVLLTPGRNGIPIYPHSAASLWTISFVIFTIMAAIKARFLKEPLFDAFAYFGGLAAWGAAGLWAGVDPYLLPATFVPALLISAALAQLVRPGKLPARPADADAEKESEPLRVPRWSLPWWFAAGYELGAVLFAVILPVAAELSGQNAVAQHFAAHATALVGLALSIFVVAHLQIRNGQRQVHPSIYHASALLLLLPVPMAAWAFHWSFSAWSAAFALPGAALALIGVALSRILKSEGKGTPEGTIAPWGLAATLIGTAGAFVLRFNGEANPQLLMSAGAALTVALTFALLRDESWGAWLASFSAALMTSIAMQHANLSSEWTPVIGCALALLGHAAWSALKRPVSAHGKSSCDLAALLCGLYLLVGTPFLPTTAGVMVGVTPHVSYGWTALFAFVLATSTWNFSTWRRGLGIALSAPALAYCCYHAGCLYGDPAPWLALLALGAVLLCRFFSVDEGSGFGVLAIFAHGTVLAGYQMNRCDFTSAAISFGLLSLALLVHSQFQRVSCKHLWAMCCETVALGYMGLSGVCVMDALHLTSARWPLALTLLGAAVLVFSKLGEVLAMKLYAAEVSDADRPFRASAPIVALILSAAAFTKLLMLYSFTRGISPELLTTSWLCGLLPLFIAVRSQRSCASAKCVVANGVATPLSALSGVLVTAGFGFMATLQLLQSGFWLTACPQPLRMAGAVYLAVILLVSAMAAIRRVSLAAVPGMFAAIGLIGCACGQWSALPAQFFALSCAVLVYAAARLALTTAKQDANEHGWEIASWIASSFAQYSLLRGLLAWPMHGTQYLAAVACLILAAARWQQAAQRRYAGMAMVAVAFAAAHGMRWLGLEFDAFGPGLMGTALLMLGVAEGIRIHDRKLNAAASRADTIISVAALTGAVSMALGLWGASHELAWQWSATLAECALGVAAVTLIVRRTHADAKKSLPARRVLILELASWLLFTLAVHAGASPHAANIPLDGPAWVLIGAVFLALGMVAESIVGALSGSGDEQRAPAFLESRHLAALGLGACGLISALCFNHAGDKHLLWRTLFALTTLAIYGSFARLSARQAWNDVAQKCSGGGAYIILLPAAYLNFLEAHSNGGSWGALYFMLLCPILLAAQYVLRREKRDDQAALANFGAWVVSTGALLLSFAGNRLQLSGVPAAVLAALALEFAVMRGMTGKRAYTMALCMAVVGSAYFGLQALIGFPLFGGDNPWAWQMPLLALLGTAMVAVGGRAKIDEISLDGVDRNSPAKGSIVALSGVATTALALAMSLVYVACFGIRAHFPALPNKDYLDAVIVSTLLLAATTLCAKRYLAGWSGMCAAGKYVPPVATLAAYLMFVFKDPPGAAEWYSVPMAVFFFSWAWQSITESEKVPETQRDSRGEREAAVLLMIGSALTVLPSFIQELPNDPVGTHHYFAMLGLAIALVFGAMLTRRKIPLLGGSAGVIIGTIVKAVQWAHHKDGVVPLMGITIGLMLVAGSTLLESRMNQAFRKAVDRARAEARMFWVSWQ